MESRVPCRIHRRVLVRDVKKYKEVLEKCILWFRIVDSIFYHIFLFDKLAIFYYRLYSCNFAFKYYATNRLVFFIFLYQFIESFTLLSVLQWYQQYEWNKSTLLWTLRLFWSEISLEYIFISAISMLQFSDKF